MALGEALEVVADLERGRIAMAPVRAARAFEDSVGAAADDLEAGQIALGRLGRLA